MNLEELFAQFTIWSNSVVASLGYFGIFLVSFAGSASIILPVPFFAMIFALGAVLNPWMIGVSAGLGSALGEITGYVIGKGGGDAIEKKHKKFFDKGRKLFEHDQAFIAIILFAATPLPDDILGIIAGMFDYDLRKFLIASFIGKTIMCLALAWGGFYGIRWTLTVFGG